MWTMSSHEIIQHQFYTWLYILVPKSNWKAVIREHEFSKLIIYGVWHAKTKLNAYYTEFN